MRSGSRQEAWTTRRARLMACISCAGGFGMPCSDSSCNENREDTIRLLNFVVLTVVHLVSRGGGASAHDNAVHLSLGLARHVHIVPTRAGDRDRERHADTAQESTLFSQQRSDDAVRIVWSSRMSPTVMNMPSYRAAGRLALGVVQALVYCADHSGVQKRWQHVLRGSGKAGG